MFNVYLLPILILFAITGLVWSYIQGRKKEAFELRLTTHLAAPMATDNNANPQRTTTNKVSLVTNCVRQLQTVKQVVRRMWLNEQGRTMLGMALFASFIVNAVLWRFNTPMALNISLLVLLPPVTIAIAYKMWMDKQLQEFTLALPDNVESFSRALTAGVPVEQALYNLSKASTGLLTEALTQVDQQQRLGVPLEKAIVQSTRLIDSIEYQFFAEVIALNTSTGGSLSETLLKLSKNMRERAAVNRKLQALTAEGRSSVKIILLIPATLLGLQYVLNPSHIEFLLNDPTGQNISTYAFVAMTIGFIWVRRMCRLDG